MMRAKKLRSKCRRCERVLVDKAPSPTPGWSASQTVKSSTSVRLTAATAVTSVWSKSQKANWRRAMETASMLRGARKVEAWVR